MRRFIVVRVSWSARRECKRTGQRLTPFTGVREVFADCGSIEEAAEEMLLAVLKDESSPDTQIEIADVATSCTINGASHAVPARQ